MQVLTSIWEFFANNILKNAPHMIGFIVLLGYLLKGEKWYTTLGGTLKAIIGMLILNVGSGGLVSNFRPILVGLKDRFNLDATVIDPYFGQNAVTDGVMEVFGKAFDSVMILLLIAFIVNILLVRFNKYTKCRTLFTTGHVQVQQASTAYWLIMFAMPALLKNDTLMLVVMAVVLGAYWAVGSNLTVKPMQELTDGAGFAIAHQQMFGIRLGYWAADKVFGKDAVKTAEEFDAKIAERLEANYKQEADYRLSQDLRKYLVDKAAVNVPEAFLKRWLYENNKEKFTKEQIEKEFDAFLGDFRWQLVRGSLMKKFDLKVEDKDMLEAAKAFAAYQYAMYGMGNVPEELLTDAAAQLLKDERQIRNIEENVENEKVIAAVKEKVTLQNKKISEEKFRALK